MESLPSDISSLSISNQEYTFTLLPTENIIPKTAFIDKFINISTVKYDGQGINYVELSLGRDIVREDRNDKVVPKMENSESSLAKLARFKGLGRQKKDIFYLGRNIDYVSMLEGSLKSKEITYIHSEAFPAGELKHGPISLIEEGTPVITLITHEETAPKTISNITAD